MGASSVTGVSGVGSAEKSGLKGPNNMRNQYVPQVCPHIVAAGVATIAAGKTEEAVVLPRALANSAAKYVVMVTPIDAAVSACSVAKTDTDGVMTGFTVTGSGAGDFQWMVVTIGYGLDA